MSESLKSIFHKMEKLLDLYIVNPNAWKNALTFTLAKCFEILEQIDYDAKNMYDINIVLNNRRIFINNMIFNNMKVQSIIVIYYLSIDLKNVLENEKDISQCLFLDEIKDIFQKHTSMKVRREHNGTSFECSLDMKNCLKEIYNVVIVKLIFFESALILLTPEFLENIDSGNMGEPRKITDEEFNLIYRPVDLVCQSTKMTCPICLEVLTGDSIVKSSLCDCNYYGHIKCLRNWMDASQNKDCPTCRYKFFE
jgi:hypothetical protein